MWCKRNLEWTQVQRGNRSTSLHTKEKKNENVEEDKYFKYLTFCNSKQKL